MKKQDWQGAGEIKGRSLWGKDYSPKNSKTKNNGSMGDVLIMTRKKSTLSLCFNVMFTVKISQVVLIQFSLETSLLLWLSVMIHKLHKKEALPTTECNPVLSGAQFHRALLEVLFNSLTYAWIVKEVQMIPKRCCGCSTAVRVWRV